MLNRLREHFRSILKCHSIIFTYCRVFGKNKIDKFCVAAVFNSGYLKFDVGLGEASVVVP